MIRSKGGVDTEAGHHNNSPSLRSTITKVVAKPAGTCRIHDMMKTKTYSVEFHDKLMDFHVIRWTPLSNGVHSGESIDRFETEQEAMEVAAILNEGEALDLYNTQSCEFDT